MREKISQLIDHELDALQREALFDQIIEDKNSAKCWQRYHFIGNVIRGEVSQFDKCLADRVANELNNEPTVAVPIIEKPSVADSGGIWSSVGMFALAASLVLVAVVSLKPENTLIHSNQIVSSEIKSLGVEIVEYSQEFDEMLAEHGEFTASPALNGLVTYAKLVSNQKLER